MVRVRNYRGRYTGGRHRSERSGRMLTGQRESLTKPALGTADLKQSGNRPKRKCPTCELDVPVKADGTLGSHRVGHRANRWPCPGENAPPRG